MRLYFLITVLILIFCFANLFAQEQHQKVQSAYDLMDEYKRASSLSSSAETGIDPAWETLFRNCFSTNDIIFDIPFKMPETGTEGGQNPQRLHPFFGNYVSLDRYLNEVRLMMLKNDIPAINAHFFIDGIDTARLEAENKITFSVIRQFSESKWWQSAENAYLVEVSFEGATPAISAIRTHNADFARSEVVITLIDAELRKRPEHLRKHSNRMYADVTIDFSENIYDRTVTEKTDASDQINLGLIANDAVIRIDSVYNDLDVKYQVADQWRRSGMKVNQQPVGGFRVPIVPYVWYGNAWQIDAGGGMIIPDEVSPDNYSSDSRFNSKPGYSVGAGITYSHFFNASRWRMPGNAMIYGAGMGTRFYYTAFKTTSDGFRQNPYPFIDRSGDSCLVLFEGANFEESQTMFMIKIPVFATIRTKAGTGKGVFQGMSLQGGVNFIIPVRATYQANGVFSRSGRYPQYNDQVITNDAFYDYYQNKNNSYSEPLDLHPIMVEAMVRLNGYFKISPKQTNNTFVAGLVFAMPFTSAADALTEQDFPANSSGDFSSVAYSRKHVYQYYFGISLGYNFIKYTYN
ncbi:MAG: hypothetical protein EOM83_01455 [Clostridia bacterium]|nr:hypothetical protein [Clostridia bacterium]